MTMKDQLAKVRELVDTATEEICRLVCDTQLEKSRMRNYVKRQCIDLLDKIDTIAQAGDGVEPEWFFRWAARAKGDGRYQEAVDDAEVRMAIDVLEDMMVGGGIHVVECDAIRTLIKAATAKTGGKGE